MGPGSAARKRPPQVVSDHRGLLSSRQRAWPLVEVGGLDGIQRLEREVVQDQQLDPGEAAHLGVQGVVQPGGFEALEQLRSWRRPLAGGNDLTRTPRAERVSNPVKE
jgi:hypothetical protein